LGREGACGWTAGNAFGADKRGNRSVMFTDHLGVFARAHFAHPSREI
jgi:hypothetical protein